jgi:hydrogenase maturation protease
MASPCVIIGYGSPIRGDDAVGPLVADQLIEQIQSPSVEVFSRHVLTADLVEDICRARLVIFLDAATDGPVGEVLCRRLRPVAQPSSSMPHSLGPAELLGWVQQLYDRCPEAYLLSVRGETFAFSHYQLTPKVAIAVEPLAAKVRELIAPHCDSPS